MFEEVAPFKDESKFDRHQSSQAAGAVTPASSDTLSAPSSASAAIGAAALSFACSDGVLTCSLGN